MSMTATKGLQDVVANESSICFIDGERGILSYRGIDIHELAEHSTFEETTYLLWNGKLPTAAELKQFSQQSSPPRARCRRRSSTSSARFRRTASPMEVLRTTVSLLSTLRDRRELHDPRRQPAQELPPHLADRDDRRLLRPHPQRQESSSSPTRRSRTPPTSSGC